MDMSRKHTMRTGALVRLASGLCSGHSFVTEEAWTACTVSDGLVKVEPLDIGMVVDDLIEEEEEFYLLVMFNEQILRADCRLLRRMK